jgi:hypothetical protein
VESLESWSPQEGSAADFQFGGGRLEGDVGKLPRHWQTVSREEEDRNRKEHREKQPKFHSIYRPRDVEGTVAGGTDQIIL